MPELPEIEALRRSLEEPVTRTPVERAGPAHVATLKTFDPPLHALEGLQLAGARRRGKHLLFPAAAADIVLQLHLMSAGRLAYVPAGGRLPRAPAFRLRFADGGELVLTERGSRRRARVGLYRVADLEAELGHLGPDALGLGQERLAAILAAAPRRLHPLLRDQRALAGIGRAWASEILHRAGLSPFALSTSLERPAVDEDRHWTGRRLERVAVPEPGVKRAPLGRQHRLDGRLHAREVQRPVRLVLRCHLPEAERRHLRGAVGPFPVEQVGPGRELRLLHPPVEPLGRAVGLVV